MSGNPLSSVGAGGPNVDAADEEPDFLAPVGGTSRSSTEPAPLMSGNPDSASLSGPEDEVDQWQEDVAVCFSGSATDGISGADWAEAARFDELDADVEEGRSELDPAPGSGSDGQPAPQVWEVVPHMPVHYQFNTSGDIVDLTIVDDPVLAKRGKVYPMGRTIRVTCRQHGHRCSMWLPCRGRILEGHGVAGSWLHNGVSGGWSIDRHLAEADNVRASYSAYLTSIGAL